MLELNSVTIVLRSWCTEGGRACPLRGVSQRLFIRDLPFRYSDTTNQSCTRPNHNERVSFRNVRGNCACLLEAERERKVRETVHTYIRYILVRIL